MPIILAIAGGGAIIGYLFADRGTSTVSNLEGLVVGAAIGVGAAAVYFSFKKI